jgi:hypothetical protein
MTDRLTGIEERLKDGTAYRPTPHRPVVNTAGDRHGVVDSSGCVVDMDSPAAARFYAAAPTDMAALLGAVRAVLALPHEDYCCTKGCPGYGNASCGQAVVPGYACDGRKCTCFMSGPIAAINAALEGQ